MTNHIQETETGLCSTCIHNANCTTRISFKGKILQCEEFDDTTFPENIPIVVKEKQTVSYAALKGLCMNCDLASTCTFPKPETGVWNCNEYR